MLTAKQERFCQNRAIKGMTQRQAYLDAYPAAKKWKPESVDAASCAMENNNNKVLLRIKELQDEEKAKVQQEAKWTRDDAHKKLTKLISFAEKEMERKGELSAPAVSAIINSTKELNTIYGVGGEESNGKGVLEDILAAVRGIDND
jgi:PAB1-binding protein PBP1